VAHDAHAARAPAPNFTHTAPAALSSQQHPAVGAAVEATPAAFNASSIGDVNLSGVKDSDAREVMDSLTKGLLQVDTPPPPTVDVDKQDDLPAVGPVEGLRMVHLTSQAPANDKKPQENVHVPSTTPAWVVNTPADPPVQVVKFVPVNGTPATPEPEPIDLVRFATKLGQSGVGEALEEIQKDDETLPGMTRILFPQGMYVDPSTNQPSHHVSKKDQTQQEKAAVQDKSFKTAKKINLGGKDSKYEKKPVSVAKLDASKPVHEKLDVVPYMVESNDNPSPVVAPLQEEPLKAVEEDPISLKFPAPIGNLDDVRDLLNMNVTFADEQPTSPPTPRPSPQPGGGDRAATESAPTSSKQADRPLLGKLDKLLNFAKEIASLGPLQPGTTDVHVHGGRASPSATSAHSAASTTSRPVTSTSAPASDPAGPTTATAEPQGPVGQAEDPLARNADLSSSTTAKQAYLNRAVQFPLRDWHDIGAARSARGSFSEVEQPEEWPGAAPTDPAKPSDEHAADDAQLFAVPPPPSATPTDDSGVVHPQASPSPTQEAAPPSPESTDEDLHFEIQDLTTTPDPTKKKKKKKKKGFRLPFVVPTTTKAPWPRSLANLAPFLPFPEDSQIRPPTLIRRPHFKPPPHAPWKHHDHGHDYNSGHDHQHGHSHAYGHNHGYKYSVEVATLPPLPADDPVQQPWYYPSQMDYSSGYQGQPATYQQTAYQQAAQPTYQQAAQPTYQQAAYLQTAYQQPSYQQAAAQQEAYPQPANQQAAYQQSNYQQAAYQQAAYQQAANQLNTYQQPANQQVTYQQAEYQQAANQQVAYQQPANQQIAYQEAGYQQAANQQVAYQQAGYQQAANQQVAYEQPANQQVAYEQPANQQVAYQQAGYQQATDQQPANQEAAYQHTANQQGTYQYPANQLTPYNQDATAASHPEQKPTSATQPFEQQAALESDVIQPPPVYTQGVYQDGGYAQAEYGPVAYQPDVFQPQYESGAYGAEGAQGPYGVQQEQPLAFYQPPTYESPSNYVHQQRRRRSPDTGAALTADTHDVAGDAEEGADKEVDTVSFADAVAGEKAVGEKETEGAVPDVEDIASKRVLAEQSPSLAEEPEATSFNEKETADGLLLSDEERSIKNVASLDRLLSVDNFEQTALDPADKMNEQIAVVSAPRADSVVDDIEAAMPATEDVDT
ncbi:uncharacterized protein LOC127752128, partial [Frankliniella occidentalis]|uniref:Uncharacterized protein LOC127752128 n=1 Tax=Frankliniella occidentalis TaxID=133901 RepID=A0A9C6XBD0_FRAOC